MEIKYLCNKRGSISNTLSWIVATLIIILLLVIYLFFMVFSKYDSTFKPDYKKFLSNSFEREFYTFLDKKILFENKETSIKELSKLIVLRGDERNIDVNKKTKISKEELTSRNVSLNFAIKQSDLKNIEKTGISYEVFIALENFISNELKNEEEIKYPFYLVYNDMLHFRADESVLKKTDFDSLSSCNLGQKDTLFREAFISKDKKITYCFTY